MPKRQMKLGLSMRYLGYHDAAWRHPDVPAGGATDFNYFLNSARIAERGKFDMVFFADGIGVRADDNPPGSLARSNRNVELEPLTLLSALAPMTHHIGLVSTASTTYNEPYHVARKFASLDNISGGRAGWNIVTSWSEQEAWNFSRETHLDYDSRYDRAQEFVEVVTGLWDSWEDDAFLHDKEAGQFYDPAQAPRPPPSRQALRRPRPAQRTPHPPGPPDPGPGRRRRAGAGDRRRQCRCRLRGPARPRLGPHLLCRVEGTHGQIRSRAGAAADHARRHHHRRPHPRRGEGEVRAPAGPHRPDSRPGQPVPLVRRPLRLFAGRAGARTRGRPGAQPRLLRLAQGPARQPHHPPALPAQIGRQRRPHAGRHRPGCCRRPSRSGWPKVRRTASISRPPTCPPASRTSWSWWYRSCNTEACFEPNTREPPCARTSACR